MLRLLSDVETKQKCHLGDGERTCSFLAMGPGGFECAYLQAGLRAAIEQRRAMGTMKAKGGPCADPHDSTSEAAEPQPSAFND